jgi:hypothetical protein
LDFFLRIRQARIAGSHIEPFLGQMRLEKGWLGVSSAVFVVVVASAESRSDPGRQRGWSWDVSADGGVDDRVTVIVDRGPRNYR